jgi:dTDP-4-amino-4,6-dideoxygalactose transaminase
VIRTENRAELKKYLHENGIQTVIHYPVPPQASDYNAQSFLLPKKYMKSGTKTQRHRTTVTVGESHPN